MDKVSTDKLKRIKVFEGLDDAHIGQIAAQVKLRHFDSGADIVREGDQGDEFFLLLEGEISISKRLSLYSRDGMDQKEKSLVRLKDSYGVCFGEMTLFDNPERSATVTAVSNVVLGVLTREQIQALTDDDPHIGYRLYFNIGRLLTANLRKANQDNLKLATAFCLALERS